MIQAFSKKQKKMSNKQSKLPSKGIRRSTKVKKSQQKEGNNKDQRRSK